MADELPLVAPVYSITIDADVPHCPAEVPPVLSDPEQARAAEAVFSQQDEQALVAGALGMYASTLLLHDLAVEAFRVPADEETQPDARGETKKRPRGR